MKEYIDREATLDIVKRTSGDYAAAWAEIAQKPAADVVEVVRCGQCRHYEHGLCHLKSYAMGEHATIMPPGGYCSYGQRKEDKI